MPLKSASDAKNFLDNYSLYLDAVGNWKSWGTKVQQLAALLAKDANYAVILSSQEQSDLSSVHLSASGVSPAPVQQIAQIP